MHGETHAEPIVVAGAGIVGLAVAWELARAGRSVLVLEREEPGAGATQAAGGMLAPISEADVAPPALVRFGLESLAQYPAFVAGLEQAGQRGACGYRDEGTLWVALDRDDAAELEHLGAFLERMGLAAKWIDALRARELEPRLSPRVTGALEVSSDHQVDPRALVRSLTRAIEGVGGRISCGTEITTVVAEDNRVVRVEGRDRGSGSPFVVESGCVIVATGALTAQGLKLPWAPPGLRAVKGQLIRLRTECELTSHVIRTPRVYLIPRTNGELLVGATSEEVGFRPAPTAGAVLDLLRYAREALPDVVEAELGEVSVGFRPAVDDGLPVIGESPIEGLYFATAHHRNGILLAPATGKHLAQVILTGEAVPALAPFAPSRLVRHEGGRPVSSVSL